MKRAVLSNRSHSQHLRTGRGTIRQSTQAASARAAQKKTGAGNCLAENRRLLMANAKPTLSIVAR